MKGQWLSSLNRRPGGVHGWVSITARTTPMHKADELNECTYPTHYACKDKENTQ